MLPLLLCPEIYLILLRNARTGRGSKAEFRPAHENSLVPMDLPDPIAAIKFRLEQQGADSKSLKGILGDRTRVYEVLRGDRALSPPMIRRLNLQLKIPAEVLIRPTQARMKSQAT